MIGRTHGIHAEPTTFGAKVALWALQLDRDRTRLRAARESVAVCKLSGAVGTYSNVEPAVEAYVGERLGLRPVPATQVIARDRHAEFLYALASIAATCELVAVELRHLQRTEVAEVLEGFKPGQKGSSAMPHKRNPISAETISGLARVVRSNLLAGLQDVALWHERDISHSSVERIVLPDSSMLVHYMTRRLNRLLGGLQIDEDGCATTSGRAMGWCSANRCCWRWWPPATSRDDAYRIVQRNAMAAWDDGHRFPDVARGRSRDDARQGGARRGVRPRALAAPPRPGRRGARRAAGYAERLMPARLRTAAGTPTSRHGGVGDALALAVAGGHLDEGLLDGPEVDLGAHRRQAPRSRSRRSWISRSSPSGSAVFN